MKKKRTESFPWDIFVVFGFALTCVCAFGVLLGRPELLGLSAPYSSDSTPIVSQLTATAETRATTIARAHATGTVRAADPSRTATIAKILSETEIAKEDVLFYDDFTTDKSGWRQGEFSNDLADVTLQIKDGKYTYFLRSKQENAIWRESVPNFSADNFQLGVSARLADTDADEGDAGVGITIHENDDGQYYQVVFWNNGSYHVEVQLKLHGGLTKIDGGTWHDATRPKRDEPDTFGILVKGSSFTISANGDKLKTVQGSTPNLNQGKVGLALDLTKKGHYLTVEFDELKIQKEP